ncbi:phage capsid protein [Streptomyces hirsutus]|uniref:Phage capsid protein n=1 Tax=Streptomyces hirsutus TaxID=35620 RepID=A0ABZ1GT79_9ACTN|nr:phage capsid protein [Streptomyces hirsutus]WSD09330.1 phage capsid protein [Streptomyces hirsutus]WTD17220.1 phage capsid protein [Streptomyces hirsutus]
MPVTLSEAKNNATDAVDVQVIDEFRKESAVLDALTFDDVVNPAGGGATLTYGYRRLVTQPTAAFRALNTEYAPSNVQTQRYSVDLAVLGGSFEVDRVIAKVGPAASGAVALNMSQKIKATKTRFQDAVINGDVDGSEDADAENGFDGLDKALRGSDTEFRATQTTNWSDFDTNPASAQVALDTLDEWLSLMDGSPTMVLGNSKALARVRALARRAGVYTRNPVDGLIGPGGRPVVRESYGDILFVDPGDKPGTSSPIIPIETRDPDSSTWTLEVTGSPTGGTYTVSVTVGGSTQTTSGIVYNASASTVQTAITGLSNVGTGNATVAGTTVKTLTFTGDLAGLSVGVTASGASLTGGTSPAVAVAQTGDSAVSGLTDLYAVRMGLDGFHGVTTVGGQIVSTYLPDFTSAGAVKKGEVEMGPVAVVLKATKAAAVFRNLKVQ